MQPDPKARKEDDTGVPVPIEAPTDPSEIAPVSPNEAAAAAIKPAVLIDADPGNVGTLDYEGGKRLFRVGTLVYTTGGLMVLFFWLLFGDFAISLRDRSVQPLMQLMLKSFDADDLIMSILLSMIPTAIALVLSPIVSYKSDRLRSRWGRRIPFLLIPTPIAAVAMIGLAFCPQMAYALESATNHAMTHKTALLMVFAFFWTLFEIAVVVAGSVFNGLINDVVPRPVLGRFFGLFRAVSLIDGMIFNWFILGHAEEHFTLICSWIAIVFGVGFTLMCFMIKEGEYPAPAAESNNAAMAAAAATVTEYQTFFGTLLAWLNAFLAAAKVYIRECFSHSHYLWIFAAFTLTALAANPINSWSILYAKKLSLGMNPWEFNGIGFGDYRLGYGGIITLTYICSLTLAYPIGALVDRFHPLRVAMVAMLAYGVSCLVGFSLIESATSFGWALLVHGVLSGCYFTSSAALAQVLLPRARFSQFASAGTVVTQTVTLIYTPLLGYLLKSTGSNYRLTFLLSGIFAVLSLVLLFKVYRTFMAMGGPKGYVAPLD